MRGALSNERPYRDHSRRTGICPRNSLQVTDFRAYNLVTRLEVSRSAWAKLKSFSLMEKHMSG